MASDPLTKEDIDAMVAAAIDNLDYARLAYGKNVSAEYLRQHCSYNIVLADEVKRLRNERDAARADLSRAIDERDAANAKLARAVELLRISARATGPHAENLRAFLAEMEAKR